MTKNDVAREIIESLRSIYSKSEKVEDAIGIRLCEGFSYELDALLRTAIDILEVPPWDKDIDIVAHYAYGFVDYTYDEMIEKVEQAKKNFDEEKYFDFCDEYKETYGNYPF